MKKISLLDYPVTYLLMFVTTVIFGLMCLFRGSDYASGQTIFEFGGLYGEIVRFFPDQLWRLFSAIFVHIGLEHFILNMISLYYLGRQAEIVFGSRNFMLLYLLSGMMGNLFVLFFTPDVLAAGASTAIFGLFTAILTLRYRVKHPYIQQLGQAYQSLFLINIAMSFLPGISLAGHVGGAIGGALCSFMLSIRGEKRGLLDKGMILGSAVFLGLTTLLLVFIYI